MIHVWLASLSTTQIVLGASLFGVVCFAVGVFVGLRQGYNNSMWEFANELNEMAKDAEGLGNKQRRRT